MPITHDFLYVKAKSVGETVKLLAKNRNAAVLAGGTDLVGELKEGLSHPSMVIDIKALKELRKIEFRSGALHLGALVTFSEIIESKIVGKHFPVLKEIAKKVASVGIRNRATMVGNLCSAVPCLDSGPVLVAMEGVVQVKGRRGMRKISAEKWFTGPRKTARKPDELVTGISIPLPKGKSAGCYVKLGRYQGEDLAQASVFVLATHEMKQKGKERVFRVAFGSVGPVPLRARKIEECLLGCGMDEGALQEAKKWVPSEVSPITDIRASREYRLHMCQIMLERALVAAEARLNGQGPVYGTNLI